MALTSLSFVAFVAAVVLVTSAVPSPTGRSVVLLVANLVFLGRNVDRLSQIAPLAAFLLLCYLAVEWARRRRSSPSLCAALAVVIATFIFLKQFSFLGPRLTLPFPYLTVGLSYVLFRALHLMIDARDGELRHPISPLHFFNYTCSFLSFTAGPIQRYQDFADHMGRPLALDEGKVFRAFARAIKGFVKVGVVSAIFKYLFDGMSARLMDATLMPSRPLLWGMYVAGAVYYTIYLYANFAGYMDIVIGIGWLLGQDLPENFNRPFHASSFLDFWSRWHMTLSDWFRTYVFNPLLKALATRITAPRVGPYLGVVAFFVTFLIMGIWHGTTSVFVVYGLLMGAGASINKLWQVMITRRVGKKRYKALSERPAAIYLGRGLTFGYFVLALSCLWLTTQQLLWLTQRLGAAGIIASYVGLAVAAGATFVAWDALASLLVPWRLVGKGLSRGALMRNLALGLQILLIATVSAFFHKSPEFVYRAF